MKGPLRALSFSMAATLSVGLWGCDNVSWGGTTMALRQPPPKAGSEVSDSTALVEELPPPLPEGDVLYVVRASEGGATLTPVGEVSPQGLIPLATEDSLPGFTARYVSERLGTGMEFNLFADGARIGRFVSDGGVRPDSSFCRPRPSVTGAIEVTPSAAGRDAFLALAEARSEDQSRGPYVAQSSTRGQRTVTQRVVGELFNQLRAQWPPDVPAARVALDVITLDGAEAPALAATFMFRDRLDVGDAPERSYALFFVAEDGGSGYTSTYVWYRRTDVEGKGAPRLLGGFDWDRDGRDEMLLEVFGTDTRWFATLDRGLDGRWAAAYEDACGVDRS